MAKEGPFVPFPLCTSKYARTFFFPLSFQVPVTSHPNRLVTYLFSRPWGH